MMAIKKRKTKKKQNKTKQKKKKSHTLKTKRQFENLQYCTNYGTLFNKLTMNEIGLSLNLVCFVLQEHKVSLFPESHAGTVLRGWKPAGKLPRSGTFDGKLPADMQSTVFK